MLKLMTPKFRVSFPQVLKPKAIGDGKAKYSMVCLFDIEVIKSDPEEKEKWGALVAAIKATATEEWGADIPNPLKRPFRKGEDKEQYDGYGEGIIYFNVSTTTQPGLVDEDVHDIINERDFYAGCYARATINPYAWTYMGKSGVSFGVQNIQKLADGEPFGGRTNATDDFDVVGGGDGNKAAASAGNDEDLFG